MVTEPEDDGQLHTLGLLEELRAECKRVWGNSSDLYFKIDGLLRQLSNPNVHEIFSLSVLRVELWDRTSDHIRWVIAALRSQSATRRSMSPSRNIASAESMSIGPL